MKKIKLTVYLIIILLFQFQSFANEMDNDSTEVMEILIVSKFAGGCEFYDRLNYFQKTTQMEHGNDLVNRLKRFEEERLNMEKDWYDKKCPMYKKYYNSLFPVLNEFKTTLEPAFKSGYCGMFSIIANVAKDEEANVVVRFLNSEMARLGFDGLNNFQIDCQKNVKSYDDFVKMLNK